LNADGPEKEPGEFGVEGIQAAVQSGVEVVDAAGEFFTEAIEFLVQGIHPAVQVDDEVTKFPEPAGIFFDFAFDVCDAFFKSGHGILLNSKRDGKKVWRHMRAMSTGFFSRYRVIADVCAIDEEGRMGGSRMSFWL